MYGPPNVQVYYMILERQSITSRREPTYWGVALCKKYKESATVINAVEAHHGDVEPQSLIACLVQAADTISAARPGARRDSETYTNRLKQLEDITNSYKGVDKSYAIQAGREVRIMVVPEQVSDDDMVLMAREISKRIQEELQYPGQIKVNVIRESRVTEYAKPAAGLHGVNLSMKIKVLWMKIHYIQ